MLFEFDLGDENIIMDLFFITACVRVYFNIISLKIRNFLLKNWIQMSEEHIDLINGFRNSKEWNLGDVFFF